MAGYKLLGSGCALRRFEVDDALAEVAESFVGIIAAYIDGEHIVGISPQGNLFSGYGDDLGLHEVGILESDDHGICQGVGDSELASLHSDGIESTPLWCFTETYKLSLLQPFELAGEGETLLIAPTGGKDKQSHQNNEGVLDEQLFNLRFES